MIKVCELAKGGWWRTSVGFLGNPLGASSSNTGAVAPPRADHPRLAQRYALSHAIASEASVGRVWPTAA